MHSPPEVDSPIPAVLLRSPRRVRRRPGTLGVLLLGRILTAPLLAISAAVLAFAIFEPIVAFLLPAQPARVVGQWAAFKTQRGIAYYVQYRFDRSGFIGHDQIFADEYQAFHLGQTIQAHVVHLGSLGYSAIDRPLKTYARHRMILWFAASFALAIGWMLFYLLWFSPWRSRRLVRCGKATFGAVVSKSIFRSGHRHLSFALTYQFKAMGALRARQIRISPQRYDKASVKDLVIVLFDPARPDRNLVYDYCDYIAS